MAGNDYFPMFSKRNLINLHAITFSFKGELPEGRHMKVDNKNFYFDIGQNNRGIYMRISEVRTLKPLIALDHRHYVF